MGKRLEINKEELIYYIDLKLSLNEMAKIFNTSSSTVRRNLFRYGLKTKCGTKKVIDITGEKFGKLSVLQFMGRENGTTMWLCECECGTKVKVDGGHLKDGVTTSCGCVRIEDLTGQKFGRLTVIRRAEHKCGRVAWYCKCDCGNPNEVVIVAHSLKQGLTLSCGCLNYENKFKHGMSKTRIYKIWNGMKLRCNNKNDTTYKYYGARGIQVCNEWTDEENGFMNFYNWSIQNGYRDDLEIERIEVDGNYEPNNCSWITHKEQMCNTRQNVFITINGETKIVAEWSRILGISETALHNGIKRGLSGEELLKLKRRQGKQSGAKYIYWNKRTSKWCVDYKKTYIGLFTELEEAIEALNSFKAKYKNNEGRYAI